MSYSEDNLMETHYHFDLGELDAFWYPNSGQLQTSSQDYYSAVKTNKEHSKDLILLNSGFHVLQEDLLHTNNSRFSVRKISAHLCKADGYVQFRGLTNEVGTVAAMRRLADMVKELNLELRPMIEMLAQIALSRNDSTADTMVWADEPYILTNTVLPGGDKSYVLMPHAVLESGCLADINEKTAMDFIESMLSFYADTEPRNAG